jgi:Zn-finger nucleic acid-binding protein
MYLCSFSVMCAKTANLEMDLCPRNKGKFSERSLNLIWNPYLVTEFQIIHF